MCKDSYTVGKLTKPTGPLPHPESLYKLGHPTIT